MPSLLTHKPVPAAPPHAVAGILGQLGFTAEAAQPPEQLRPWSDPELDAMAAAGLLQAGDVVIRSNRVAMVHAGFLCIEASAESGTSSPMIADVLPGNEPEGRVVRCTRLEPRHLDLIHRACAFYLTQPDKIRPSPASARRYPSCSELVRKIYRHCGLPAIGIPDSFGMKPSDFARLADQHPDWSDVTEAVRPAVKLCRQYPQVARASASLLMEGLRLHRKKFEERTRIIETFQASARSGNIPREQVMAVARKVREIENNPADVFWDVHRGPA